MGKTVTVNVKIDEYANKVYGVVKEKYGLKDKGEAMSKFAEMYGEDLVEKEVDEETIKNIVNSCNKHIKKHGFRSRDIDDITRRIEAE